VCHKKFDGVLPLYVDFYWSIAGIFLDARKLFFSRPQLHIILELDTTSLSLIYTIPDMFRLVHHKVIGNARFPLDRLHK
jgi:hypothetical protein